MPLPSITARRWTGIFGIGLLSDFVKSLRDAAETRLAALEASTTGDDWKQSVLLASAATIANLSSVTVADFDGTGQGVTLTAGKRVLVKNNASPDGVIATHGKYQGIYVVGTVSSGSAPLTRASDADVSAEVTSGLVVEVTGGTYAAQIFVLTTADPITLGTTALTFALLGVGVPAPSAASKLLYDTGSAYAATGAGTAGQVPVVNAGATAPAYVSVSGDAALASTGALTVSKMNGITLYAVAPVLALAVANVASLSGAQTVDGVALVAGNRVYLANQTTPAQNGIWIVQSGAWTRPTDWATGATIPLGTVIRVAPGGTANFQSFGSEWYVDSAGGVVDTGTIVAYPKIVHGSQALSSASPSTATVSSLWIKHATATSLALCNQTTAANGVKGVLTAGAGSGTLVITGPNTVTDVISYTAVNG